MTKQEPNTKIIEVYNKKPRPPTSMRTPLTGIRNSSRAATNARASASLMPRGILSITNTIVTG